MNILANRTALALGNFDGLHLGHQKLIDLMINKSIDLDLVPSVVTFDCNFNKFKLGTKNNVIMSKEQKELYLKKLGVKVIHTINFDDTFMKMSPEDFIKEIIVKKLNAKLIVVGYNFRFGYMAKGNINTLKELSEKYDFDLNVIPPVSINNTLISSTEIRNLIKQGKVLESRKMLGRNYVMKGAIVPGMGRGKKLGFATANLKLDTNYTIPKYGVYKTLTKIDGKEYLSITNVGQNPTFNDIDFSLETHIIDFNKDIYEDTIEIEFVDFIRAEIRFNSVKDLINQVKLDIEKVKYMNK